MKKTFKSTISFVLVLSMILSLFGLQISAETAELDLTVGSGDGWTWSAETKTLTLSGASLEKCVVLPEGANIVVNGDNTINGGDTNAITCEGALTVSGSGSLKLTGTNGITASSVSINGIAVDFAASSCGIQVTNSAASAVVELTSVTGIIKGGYAGIYVNGEFADSDAKVVIDTCTLDVTSTATSYNNRARKSGITVYVSKAERVDSSITIKNSKVVAIGSDAGLSINNYLGDADATNSACSTINIENSTVTAEGTNGTWAGIFASVLGQHPDADSIINIKNSSVYAVSPNTGILTSSQKGESKIILDDSVLGAKGNTALSMIEATSQAQVAELNNGSTYIQMTPAAVMKGEISVFDGKTIVADSGNGIVYDAQTQSYVITKGSKVTETYTDGTSNTYTFKAQAGGIGGYTYQKEEIWGYDTGNVIDWSLDDPIIITTPAELMEFATITQNKHEVYNNTNNFDVTFNGRTVLLGANIDMTGYDWYYRNAEGTVVTDHRIPNFVGTFDGQGYEIKNMSYRDEYKEATEPVSLAFIIQGKSILKNLTLNGITVDTVAPAYFAGLVKDYAWSGASSAYVDGCTVKNITVNAKEGFTFGGMFYRLVGGNYINNCHVEKLTVTVEGTLVGDNSGRNGGFVATGGEPMKFSNCSVKNFVVNSKAFSADPATPAQGGMYLGGFIGGASMTGSYDNCDVEGFTLNANAKFGAVGGFAAYTAGSAWGEGLVIRNCDVTGLDINSTARISSAGGFIGYVYGQGTSIEKGAHHFLNCTAEGAIDAGSNSNIGGFIGWLYGRSGGCVAEFNGCTANVDILTDKNSSYAGGFVGYHIPYNNYKMVYEFTNCTAWGDVYGLEPVGSPFTGIIGGTYNYDPEDVNTETGDVNNVAAGYRALDNGDGTWTVYPSNGKEVIKVAFHRWNKLLGAYENWRTVEIYEGSSFVLAAHDSKKDVYRFDVNGERIGLSEINTQAAFTADGEFCCWTDAPNGTETVLTNDTTVNSDIAVYAHYGYKVEYKFEGNVPAGVTVPDAKVYGVGMTVVVADAPVAVDGYVFSGWNTTGSFTMPANNVVITGTWTKIASSSIEGVVTYDGELYSGQFTFVLLEDADNDGEIDDVVATTTNDNNGNFSFELTFTNGGTHEFVVDQIEGNPNSDIIYDTAKYEVFVIVDNFGGTAIISEDILFHNSLRFPAIISIDGNVYLDGAPADGFTFVLESSDGKERYTAISENGIFNFGSFEFDEEAIYEYVIYQVVPANTGKIDYDTKTITILIDVRKADEAYIASMSIKKESSISFYNTTINLAPADVTVNGRVYLDGKNAEGFTLKLIDENGKAVTVTSEKNGKFSFGSIKFTEEGIYTFTVSQINDGKEGIVYDKSVYTVTVEVYKHNKNKLSANVSIAKAGESAKEIAFYNETEVVITEDTTPLVPTPDTTEPEVTEPEVTEPEVTEPEVTEPEITEPEVTEPEVTEPEVTEPEVTDPEEEITDPDVPLDPAPDTGDNALLIILAAVAALALGVVYFKRRQTTEE